MLNKLYIWKDKNLSSRRLPIMIGSILVICILLSISAGYFLIYIPKKERLANEEITQQQLEQKRQQLSQYYLDVFSGGHISSLNRLLVEMARSRIPLEQAGYQEESVTCDSTHCHFQYRLKSHGIFNLQHKLFWNALFTATFSANEINFQEVPSKLENHPTLLKHKSQEGLDIPLCATLLSYIHAHNTAAVNKERLTLITAPESSISSIEHEIGHPINQGKNLLNASWEVELPRESIYVMQYFKTLAYPDAFFIKEIAVSETGTKISGGLSCININGNG